MSMGRRIGQFCLFLVLLILSGCKGMLGSQGMPPDPLCANRKPAESKANAGPPTDTPYSEPTPPVNP